ncbi:MAG: hypothetical protein CL489_10240 [Acidobacteria bacterium]|nr:hypothetical protein [Acidobacteriota bacterium]|tara:strand:+ start:5012 stop:5665 length:654 start_codon:yes stop_codon:yes gene_type:complete
MISKYVEQFLALNIKEFQKGNYVITYKRWDNEDLGLDEPRTLRVYSEDNVCIYKHNKYYCINDFTIMKNGVLKLDMAEYKLRQPDKFEGKRFNLISPTMDRDIDEVWKNQSYLSELYEEYDKKDVYNPVFKAIREHYGFFGRLGRKKGESIGYRPKEEHLMIYDVGVFSKEFVVYGDFKIKNNTKEDPWWVHIAKGTKDLAGALTEVEKGGGITISD